MTDNLLNPSCAAGRVPAATGPAPRALDRRRVPRNGRCALVRNPGAFADQTVDLIVVGGGAFGAWAAYDAAQRGLSVALLERGDFGQGVSAQALRGLHARAASTGLGPAAQRRAAAERSTLMRLAPHLVRPLEVVVPRYGGGRWAVLQMAAACVARAAAAAGTGRRLHDRDRRDRWGGVFLPGRLRALLPDLPRHRLAGGERVPGLQVVCPERLVLAVVQSAACRGAQVMNHAEVDALVIAGDAVTGVTVSDRHSGGSFSVRARAVLNATGPDAGDLLLRGNRPVELPAAPARDELMLFIQRDLVAQGRALALPGGAEGEPLLVAPSADGGSLIGPWAVPDGARHTPGARRAAVEACLAAVNRACPAWRLGPEDVTGLSVSGVPRAEPGGAAEVVDHAERDGLRGLFSLVGCRYASAYAAAGDAVDQVMDQMGLAPFDTQATRVPLVGGDIVAVRALSEALFRDAGGVLERAVLDGVLRRHGAHAPARVRAALDAGATGPLPGTRVLAAELVHAAEAEAGVTLADVLLRRSGLAGRGGLEPMLTVAADTLAPARGWSDADHAQQLRRLRAEIAEYTLARDADGAPVDPPDYGHGHAA